MPLGGTRAGGLAALGMVVVLATAIGCQRQEEHGEPSAATTSAAAPAPSAPPDVELVDPGAEPRELLRFALIEGQETRATMSMKMVMDLEVDGEPTPGPAIPPMLIDMSAKTNRISPDGDIDYTFTYEDFRVGDETVLTPEAQQAFDQLSGITGQAVMAPNGKHKNVHIDIPPDVDPQMRNSLEGMSSQLTNITVPFPTEPVGIGGRWQVHASTVLNGLQTDVTSVYELRERTGDQYRTGVTYQQSAPDQDANLPNLPAGYTAHVDGVAISGSGEVSGSFATLFPLDSSMHGAGTIDMRVDDGQSSANMHQNMEITVGLQPTV